MSRMSSIHFCLHVFWTSGGINPGYTIFTFLSMLPLIERDIHVSTLLTVLPFPLMLSIHRLGVVFNLYYMYHYQPHKYDVFRTC